MCMPLLEHMILRSDFKNFFFVSNILVVNVVSTAKQSLIGGILRPKILYKE